MTVIGVTSADDPRIAPFRQIREPDLIRGQGLFVAEGRLVVERALAAGYEVVSLAVNGASFAALQPALDRHCREATVLLCDGAILESVTGFDVHRGCLALVRRPPATNWRNAVRGSSIVVVLDQVSNADNVGGVFRNAAAFGAGGVLLSPGSCDPLYRKAIRTSMAASLRVPFARLEPWPGALDQLRADGFTLVALSLRHPSIPLANFVSSPRPARLALLLGSEGTGLSDGADERCDVRVRIPIGDAVDSLNLAVACGIALSQLSVASG